MLTLLLYIVVGGLLVLGSTISHGNMLSDPKNEMLLIDNMRLVNIAP